MQISLSQSFSFSRDEYDFLPIDGPLQNKNPVIIAGHKVALELWAVKVLYLHAHSRLVGHAVKEVGRKVLGKCSSVFGCLLFEIFPKLKVQSLIFLS